MRMMTKLRLVLHKYVTLSHHHDGYKCHSILKVPQEYEEGLENVKKAGVNLACESLEDEFTPKPKLGHSLTSCYCYLVASH